MKLLDYLQVLHPNNKISSPKIYDGQLYYYRLNDRLVEAQLCVEPKQYQISDLEVEIETRDKYETVTCQYGHEHRHKVDNSRQIYIYVFHKNFIYDFFDDTTHLYEILNEDFYKEFEYVFDKNNLFSLNEYTPKHMKTEQECADFLKSIGFNEVKH